MLRGRKQTTMLAGDGRYFETGPAGDVCRAGDTTNSAIVAEE
jgi:hypothetical protein